MRKAEEEGVAVTQVRSKKAMNKDSSGMGSEDVANKV